MSGALRLVRAVAGIVELLCPDLPDKPVEGVLVGMRAEKEAERSAGETLAEMTQGEDIS